jgi:carbonic anhydrase/acetyltransferase-like protein (isoleucine patch superfamily)
MIYEWNGMRPQIPDDVFIAPNSIVLGDVQIGKNSSIWFGSVVRGDVNYIRIGEGTNVQDLCILHVTEGKFPLIIGSYVTLAHRVTVHGCTVADHAFIGMEAVVMDGAELGEYSFLAAGSLLPPGKKIPPRMLAMGSPAKVIREINADEEAMMKSIPARYSARSKDYMDGSKFKLIG